MLDLENQIQIWRVEMLKVTGSEEIVAELESHLRESLDIRLEKGLDPVKAWEETQRELGSPQHLAPQFALNTKPLPWLPSRIFGYLLFLGLVCNLLLFFPIFGAQKMEYQIQNHKMDQNHAIFFRLYIAIILSGYWTLFAAATLASWFLLARQIQNFTPGQWATVRFWFQIGNLITVTLFTMGILINMIWSIQASTKDWNPEVEEYIILLMAWMTKEYASFLITLSTIGVFLLTIYARGEPKLVARATVGNLILGLLCFMGPHLTGSKMESYGYSLLMIARPVFSLFLTILVFLSFLPPGWLISKMQTKTLG